MQKLRSLPWLAFGCCKPVEAGARLQSLPGSGSDLNALPNGLHNQNPMKTQDKKSATDKFEAGQLLDVLRAHTAMYMGVRKLSALSSFLDGWRFALNVYDIEFIDPLPRDFHEWVAYPLHFRESTSGYKNMILERVPDKKKAGLSDRFFELLDEYRMRHARVVARLSAFAGREYFLRFKSDGTYQQQNIPRPLALGTYTLKLIAYTNDPGFFVQFKSDDPTVPPSGRFYPVLRWFERDFGTERDKLRRFWTLRHSSAGSRMTSSTGGH